MIRGDLSNRLIHLTKGADINDSVTNFINIIREGRLIGGNGHVRGRYNCVCFSEAPISTLSQVLANPSVHGMRYAPLGIMVDKSWLFDQGGRPVIYQPDDEYDLLPEKLKFRHVRYEPNRAIDHTWEREWRICTNELFLDPAQVTLVVPTREWEERFQQEHVDFQQGWVQAVGDIAALGIDRFPWHFIVLEDLGVEFVDGP